MIWIGIFLAIVGAVMFMAAMGLARTPRFCRKRWLEYVLVIGLILLSAIILMSGIFAIMDETVAPPVDDVSSAISFLCFEFRYCFVFRY